MKVCLLLVPLLMGFSASAAQAVLIVNGFPSGSAPPGAVAGISVGYPQGGLDSSGSMTVTVPLSLESVSAVTVQLPLAYGADAALSTGGETATIATPDALNNGIMTPVISWTYLTLLDAGESNNIALDIDPIGGSAPVPYSLFFAGAVVTVTTPQQVFLFTVPSETESGFSAFVVVPEPSSLAYGAMVAGVAAFRAFRRRTA